jgi:Carboxypeptidase regulatory-like domain
VPPTAQQPLPPLPSSISGTIVDPRGTPVAGAHVTLTRQAPLPIQQLVTGDNGFFSFTGLTPGPFHLSITAPGFTPQSPSGTLRPGEDSILPPTTLALAPEVTQVNVEVTPIEIAQEELHEQEQQRVLGVLPNFYVSYVPDAVPLTPKQKFQLALRAHVDPVTFVITGGLAGIEQAENRFPGYGQGAQGYAKRYGAAYTDLATNSFIGNAILPSLLKPDPRYFYKPDGSARSRFFYAVANAVICKGDNGHWQPSYSAILGSLASGGISNLYYPPADRNGAALTFENALIDIGATAAANVLQEFVLRKFTSGARKQDPTRP